MSDTLKDAPESLGPDTYGSAPTLSVVHSPDATAVGRRVILERGKGLFVGRGVDEGLCIRDERLSRRHFMVAAIAAGVECADVGSSNGTFVNGIAAREIRLAGPAVVRAGDTLFVLSFEDAALRILDRAQRLASTLIPILLQGESGSGKEVLARTIHQQSGRRGPFVPVNCATLPRELFGSELFGHVKSSFSGAAQARAGLFRAAEGGTLFLDEVADLPLEQQPALLRALEERRVRPVGADQEVPVDVRVLAATHIDLERAVSDGKFRADLQARLAHVVLRLPPLRERRAHLLALATSFAPRLRITPDAAEALLLWHWPRNVRELRALMEVRDVLNGDQTLIRLRSLTEQLPTAVAQILSRGTSTGSSPPEPAEAHPAAERRAQLLALLEAHGGNVSQVAAQLGKPRAQIYRWLRAAGLDVTELRSRREQ